MKKILMGTLLATLSAGAFANLEEGQEVLVASREETAVLNEVRQDGFREEYPEIALVEERPHVRTTTAFTGIEYERFNNRRSENVYDVSYILADGFTSLSENWGIVHIVKRRQTYIDGDRAFDANVIEFYPRYDKTLTDNYAFGFEFGVESAVVDGENGYDGYDDDRFKIRPDVTYTNGNHLLNVPILGVNVSQDGTNYYEFEPTYIYTLNDTVNLGLQGFRRDGDDDFIEQSIRPFMQFNFANTAFLELKVEIGTFEDKSSDSGVDQTYIKPIVYGEYPVTESLRTVTEFSFATKSEDNDKQTAGDQDVYFLKAGLKWTL